MTHFFDELYNAHLTFGHGGPYGQGYQITWREILGNAFGFASAIGGLRRKVWAWPVGIVGNVLLFTVFVAVTFGADERGPLLGQAGRQVFFIITSVYGWYRWRQTQEHSPGDVAVRPRWATGRERLGYLVVAVVAILLCRWLFGAIGAGFPVPSWYFWCDAWIFVGSMLATYAMARGWTDFWLVWIAVDLVGVPELWHFQLYPSALLFIAYGVLVVYGFVVWLRVSRVEAAAPEAVKV